MTPRPQDIGAADETSDLVTHFDLLHQYQDLLADLTDSSLVIGGSFIRHYWDPTAEAIVWHIDDQGEMQAAMKEVGEVCRCVVPAFEVYPDPEGRSVKDWKWLIQCKRHSLEYIKEHFGKRGAEVEPGSSDGYSGYIDSRLDAITGDSVRVGQSASHSNYVYEMWEKPSKAYPKGRRIVVAGDRLMSDPEHLDWPYDDKESFPYVQLPYRKRSHSVWPRGVVHDMVPLQRQLNNIISRANDKINAERITILVPESSEISTDSFHLRNNMQKVVYSGDLPPTYVAPPPVSPDVFNMVTMIEGWLEDISGAHDPSQGQTPPGVTSGVALELLQMADQSLNSGFTRHIEQTTQESMEGCIALARQYYKEPRLIAVGTSADDKQNQIAAHDFRNLSAGGQVRVRVTPGSAIGKSPAAMKEQLMELVRSGALSPANLPATTVLLQSLKLIDDNQFIRNLQALVTQQAQQQAQEQNAPMMAAQMKAQADAQAQAGKTQGDLQIQESKNQGALQVKQQDGIQKGQLIEYENEFELQQQEQNKRTPPVTIALKGTLGSAGTIGAEQAVGLPQTDTLESMQDEQDAQTASAIATKTAASPQQTKPKG
jgi:hypothetical protein